MGHLLSSVVPLGRAASWYCLLIVSTRREIGWFPLSARSTDVDAH